MGLSREQRVGLFFLGGILLFVGFIEATVGTGLFSRGYRVWAEFADVQGLNTGAQIRVAGVKAGTVREIRLEPNRVRVGGSCCRWFLISWSIDRPLAQPAGVSEPP